MNWTRRSRNCRSERAHCKPRLIRIEIIFQICPNAVAMQPAGNESRLSSAGGAVTRCGGVRRPGGAPGLQNQRGAQQSPRWVRFPSASASFLFSPPRSRPRPRGTGVLECWSGGRRGNIERRTPNAERRMPAPAQPGVSFDVGCWMPARATAELDVGCSRLHPYVSFHSPQS